MGIVGDTGIANPWGLVGIGLGALGVGTLIAVGAASGADGSA